MAITFILLLVIITGRFVKYLQQAAVGNLSPKILFSLMGYRIPGFLEMTIPIAFFISILLVYGRMYADSEMTALEASGFSPLKLLKNTFITGIFMALITALFSLWLTPWGMSNVETIFKKQREMTAFDALTVGRFQSWSGQTTYVESLKDNRQTMKNIFIAQPHQEAQTITLLLADTGSIQLDEESRDRYLMLSDGYRYDIAMGKKESKSVQYKTYGIKMKDKLESRVDKEGWMPFSVIFNSKNTEYQAEWLWRISLPLQIFIGILIAVPMSKVNPRQGRYYKVLPGTLIFLIYMASLVAAKGAIKNGNIPPILSMSLLHGLFLTIGILLCFMRTGKLFSKG